MQSKNKLRHGILAAVAAVIAITLALSLFAFAVPGSHGATEAHAASSSLYSPFEDVDVTNGEFGESNEDGTLNTPTSWTGAAISDASTDSVISGVFGLATRLYGITFKANSDIPVFHPDVKAYEVYDNDGSYLAVLYADFHPRESKQSGAWMTSFKDQWMEDDGTNSRPHISITTNFTKPTPNKPALLTLEEVETFLHEFGHALHGMFANTRYASMSGTSVYRDFVELPSQIMENFAIEKEFLHTFARHYQTGELLPDEYVERIIRASNFNVAYACLRQVSFGLLDMAWYTRHEDFDGDVRAYEQEAWAKAQLLPVVPDTCMSVQFSHIMDGGYSAGYYSYKWAEVLDADAFSVFKQKGIFNREVAASFREQILSKGGTEHPMVLYRRFRGQEPTIEALLRRNGIITGDK